MHLQGCSFRWTQAIWRKTQEIGLAVACRQDPGTRHICHRLLALPLLAADDIEGAFHRLSNRATTDHLEHLFRCVLTTWVDSNLCPPPRAWSVFGKSIRTNNDVEGWHWRLNERAKNGQANLYSHTADQLLAAWLKVHRPV